MQPIDQKIRQQAMDPQCSAIVSAPAGSGKTYLLTRRIINLLLCCKQPEEVIAITFTKKAANEMRERLIHCLTSADEANAKKLLQHADQLGWDLINQTQRLQIMTIDAFCIWLLDRASPARQPGISSAPQKLYQKTVYQYFQSPWSASQKRLLTAMGGQYKKVEQLLTQLLAIRDQWQDQLKTDIATISEQSIQALRAQQTEYCETQFVNHIPAIKRLLSIISDLHQRFMPEVVQSDQEQWEKLSALLLTKQGTLRSKLTKAQGIYPKSMIEHHPELLLAQKEALEIIEGLKVFLTEHSKALETLKNMQQRPQSQSPEEKHFLDDLSNILRALLEMLEETFVTDEHQDFTHIALKAVQALKDDQCLQSYCQAHIHHVLMDEFQDTSNIQYALAQGIIKNWPKTSHRTFFAVGDPMQSIYRFRQADVRLFIKTQSEAIEHIKPLPLFLQCNFRSSTQMITAINAHFANIFPAEDDLLHAAICYRPAVPTKPSPKDAGIYLEYEENTQASAQAYRAIEIIRRHQEASPSATIGVLAQTRSHFKALIPALENASIQFNAIDIYPLGQLAAISDLSALLGYLYQPNDQIAFYTLLRSPLCGLSLNDLKHYQTGAELSEAGYHRLNRLNQAVRYARQQNSLDCVIQCWLTWSTLSGDQLYPEAQISATRTWFDEVTQLRMNQLCLDQKSLQAHFSRTHMSITHLNCRLNLLTAHKSKGLEYDHVIILHTEKRTLGDDLPLLYAEASPYPLIQPTFLKQQQNTEYLKSLNKKRGQYESMRLLYVAATRAKNTLHLIANPSSTNSNSWIQAFEKQSDSPYTYQYTQNTATPPQSTEEPTMLWYSSHTIDTQTKTRTEHICFEHQAHEVGTTLHFLLEHFDCPKRSIRFENHLLAMGYDAAQTYKVNTLKDQLLANINASQIGQWIFTKREKTFTEYRIDGLGTLIIDRLFIEDDTVWIIDYKFHETALTDQQLIKQHQVQLQQYTKAIKKLYPTFIVRAGIYAPLHNQWVEAIKMPA